MKINDVMMKLVDQARRMKDQGIPEDQIQKAIRDPLALVPYIQRYLGQLLILNTDWLGWNGGNVKLFVQTDGTIVSIHYDFDLSALVGKAAWSARPDNKDHQDFSYPASTETDLSWLRRFCGTDGEMFSASEMAAACPSAVSDLLPHQNAVVDIIQSIEGLDKERKQRLIERSKSFFSALNQFVNSLP
jgi:hypothetical protein